MKKKIMLGVVLVVFAWAGVASAALIGLDWATTSPTQNGVLIEHLNGDIEKISLGTDTRGQHGQPMGTYSAEFFTEFGGELDIISLVFQTLDSWNPREGYYDRLLVTVSDIGFRDTETIFWFGGESWTDGRMEKYGVSGLSMILEPGQYFSLALETKRDTRYSSMAIGEFSFSENSPAAPVPEPASIFLFGTGIAGLVGVARKRRKQ